jgi:2-polyprenyl-3-methyl-5-hydroxy-6-metoxy-1,4-benzoquinol methylase
MRKGGNMNYKMFAKERCANLAPTYSGAKDRYDLLQQLIKDYRPHSILDVGCVTGYFTEPQRYITLGLDLNVQNVETMREAGRRAIATDLDSIIPLGDRSFDLIWCGETIEHIFYTETLVCEMFRLLEQNGRLILSTPNLASWINILMLPFGLQPLFSEVSSLHTVGNPFRKNAKKPGGHIRLFTWRSLKGLLELYGFKNIKFYNANLLTNKWVRLVDNFIPPKYCSDLFITAVKP